MRLAAIAVVVRVGFVDMPAFRVVGMVVFRLDMATIGIVRMAVVFLGGGFDHHWRLVAVERLRLGGVHRCGCCRGR
jgi:hypothetical protein